MASKIFMGDMPELMENILNNVKFHSIYSCALVSRHWCKMSIPILWQNPFTYNNNPLFISQYLLSLDENEKSESRIDQWINLKYFNLDKPCESLKCQIMKCLLKLFVENGAILHKLDLYFDDYELQSEILHLFRRNERFVSQLQELSLAGISRLNIKSECNEEFKVLMNCKNLKILRIKLEYNGSMTYASHIVHILEKSGTLLQRLKIESDGGKICGESLLLRTLKSFCPNITYLNISCIRFSTQFKDLICNLQKLQFLTLRYINDVLIEEEEELKTRVMQFAKILPSTLQYLDLRYTGLNLYIDILLNNCCAPLKNLLINNIDNEKTTEALIKFCIRKRTLNYVGINIKTNSHIKKEVEVYVKLVPSRHIIVSC
ncbi:hypothetical protein C2G38_2246155 [Gigaspora rosea]|uniref:F-box domain-containing protein n=1 Tax=Gigaspora rosea TaxID=44941 RepID=A0A397V7B8_9GLOM|nr:hypothetical protein C2G38_2246155 [Gigaspora rosea]